jgi:hypothetical protein
MLIVVRIANGFQEVIETLGSTGVFRRALQLAVCTNRIDYTRFRRQDFLDNQ